jgi:hypothetical protein
MLEFVCGCMPLRLAAINYYTTRFNLNTADVKQVEFATSLKMLYCKEHALPTSNMHACMCTCTSKMPTPNGQRGAVILMSSSTGSKTIESLSQMFASFGLPEQLVSDRTTVHMKIKHGHNFIVYAQK